MSINANNIVPEFREADMNAIIQAYPLGELYYRENFPLSFNPTLTYANIEGQEGAKVMADIVAIGSKAPRKGREFVESVKGEIPKTEIARDLTEKDLNIIQELRHSASLYPNNVGIKNRLISKIYEDAPFCIDGINARMEWMAKQLASTGKYKTTAKDNAGGVANVVVDFKIKTKNATKNWHTAPDADPIKDIEMYQEEARGNGYRYVTMTMDRATLNIVLNKKSTRSFVLGIPVNDNTVLPNVSLEQLNAQLSAKSLPIIKVWDSFVSAESKAGEVTSLTGWEEGNVLFSSTYELGTTQYTTTEEFRLNVSKATSKSIKDNFILVKTFGQEDPILISTKATAFATPVLNDAKRKLIIKTKF